MISLTRLTLPFSVVLLLAACGPAPEEVVPTSDGETSSSTSAGPGPTTPGTTMPGEDTVGTVGATGTDTTMGVVDTTVSESATDETTDPSTSSGSESSGTTEPPLPPDCDAMNPCPNNETCNAMGECESVCAAGWGANDYSYCVTPLGTFDSMTICGEMMSCVVNYNVAGDIDAAVCGRTCATPCDCPAPAGSGDATVSCGDFLGSGANRCYLSCDNGETCPGGMTCLPGEMGSPDYCTYTVQAIELYGNCDGFAAGCVAGSTCATYFDSSVCISDCAGAGDCAMTPMGTTYDESCEEVYSTPGNECHIPCLSGADCLGGMSCVDIGAGYDDFCMWS